MIEEIKKAYEQAGAIKEGHFVFTSGLHSGHYVNGAKLMSDTESLFAVCKSMAPHFYDLQPEAFVCPSEGANIFVGIMSLAYNLSRPQGTPKSLGLYASKMADGSGNFYFKRDQEGLVKDRRVVVLDDTGTTGSSTKKVVELARKHGGKILSVTYLCIRGNITPESVGNAPEVWSPFNLDFPNYTPEECPLCRQGIPIDTALGHGAKYVTEHGQPVAKR